MSPSRADVAVRTLIVVGVLASAVVALCLAGHGSFAAPPLRSWDAASHWYDQVGPELAIAVAVRLLALAIAAWLLLGASVELVALLGGGDASRWLADLIAPRSLQRLVHGLAGLSLTAGLAVVAPSAGMPAVGGAGGAILRLAEEPPPAGTATMHLLEAPVDEPMAPPAEPAPAVPVPPAVAVSPPAPASAVAPTPAPSAPAAPVADHDEVVVEAGDCFWSISADALADALGRIPDEREIAAHWRRLVTANRDRLVDPLNPDLLFPGQVLVVPPA